MRSRQRIGGCARSRKTKETVVSPPSGARPRDLEASRAVLLKSLACEPAVCRSVGLVR